MTATETRSHEGVRTRTVTWTERLGTSQTEDEVVAAVREYLALLSHEEVETLPASCRPVRMTGPATTVFRGEIDLPE